MGELHQQQVQPGAPLPESVYSAHEPVLLPGYVANWPAVQAARQSSEALADYLTGFDANKQLTVYVGGKEIAGRFFYNEDCTGFNFQSGRAVLGQVLARMLTPAGDDGIHSIYVGSTPVDGWLPGFRADNDVKLPVDDAMASFWLGTQTTVSAHFDFPDNLACVVAGRRRFTLFPPDQLENLYVGPLDRTPAGQAISLVDFANPDFARFPKFEQALAHAIVADLAPGDALFIPGMWWHHVASQADFNLLVNYWWAPTPAAMGAPSAALSHAILSLRALPARQRAAWKHLFDHYVFNADEQSVAHIPQAARGVLGALDDATIEQARKDLVDRLTP